jgi:hypothetical protein
MAEKAGRQKEADRLLGDLQRMGLRKPNPSYREIERLVMAWVEDGVALTTVVDVYRYGLLADLVLPAGGRPASVNLRSFTPEDDGSKDTNT